MNAEQPDAIILGCVKGKISGSHAARDLYASPLWRRRRAYAEESGVPWFVFSAKHGLLRPETMISKYNVSMADLSRTSRMSLGAAAATALAAALGGLKAKVVQLHAGVRYRDAIEPAIRALGGSVDNPLAGLSIGHQLQWYDTRPRRG